MRLLPGPGDLSLLLLEERPEPSAADLWPLALTPREAEVLLWAARGKTDAEIAALLVLSPRSVQTYLGTIYQKLGVRNRTEATARALAALRPEAWPTGD